MRTAFYIITGLVMLFITWVYPFIAILRGKRILPTVCICWVGLFLYLLALSLGLPCLVGVFDQKFAHEMCMSWVPDGTGAGATLVIGWLPPSLAAVLGMAVKSLLKIHWPATLMCIQKGRKNGEAGCADTPPSK
jgi:hypothetical protein